MEAYQAIRGLSEPCLSVELDELVGKIEGRTAMLCAAAEDDVSFIAAMHQRGLDLDVRTAKGNGLAHYAAERGSLKVLRYLAEHKLDLNATNQAGQAPLHRAAALAQVTAFQTLAQAGADVWLRDKQHEKLPYEHFKDRNALFGPNWKANPLEDVFLLQDREKAVSVMALFETDQRLPTLVQDLDRKYPNLAVEDFLPEYEAGRYRALAIRPEVNWGQKA